jgi:hypothetical protein
MQQLSLCHIPQISNIHHHLHNNPSLESSPHSHTVFKMKLLSFCHVNVGRSSNWSLLSNFCEFQVMYTCLISLLADIDDWNENINLELIQLWWPDHLYGLAVRVPGCRLRGPGFDSGRYKIF